MRMRGSSATISRLIAVSLKANKGVNAGLFYVERLLRRIDTFGFHLATLDVRQHASVLHQVIAQGCDDPHWLTRSSRERRDLLAQALEKDRGPAVELDALGRRMLAVFDAIMQGRHRYGPDAIGYFIVSGACGAMMCWRRCCWRAGRRPSTSAAARWRSISRRNSKALRPLSAAATPCASCSPTRLYRRHLEAHGRRQCVLIGYSDSNKEAGACASRFTIHQAQRTLARVLAAAGEQHVLFHARGGSVARGGGRIDAMVSAAPAGGRQRRCCASREQGADRQAKLRPAPHRHAHAGARLQRAGAHHRARAAANCDRDPPEQLRCRAARARPAAPPTGAWCSSEPDSTIFSGRSRPSM